MNTNNPVELPKPDLKARQRSEQLSVRIKQVCTEQGGYIHFSEYMRHALYTPLLGYYSSGTQKFGQQGDFITAPEVSPLFAQCLARQVVEIFSCLDKPCILEFGAGSGVLAVDLLRALETLDALPEHYYILELSAELQRQQRQLLTEKVAHLYTRVTWLQQLPAQPLNGVVIANEVLDAMPVECFSMRDGAAQTMVVQLKDGQLVPAFIKAGTSCQQALQRIEQRIEQQLPINYCSEYNSALQAWLQGLYQSMDTGVVLLIDYGYHAKEYYHPDRVNGTLMCYYQHRANSNALWYPGLQDITAFIDFTDVAYSALAVGFSVSGYNSQAAFLLANGLSDLHAEQVTDNIQQQIVLSQQIKTLTLPSEMGERFKVMALTKKFDMPLCGFALQDYRNRL